MRHMWSGLRTQARKPWTRVQSCLDSGPMTRQYAATINASGCSIVAGDLFAEHGFDDVTMADIATAADVARATVFNYFGSKHALDRSAHRDRARGLPRHARRRARRRRRRRRPTCCASSSSRWPSASSRSGASSAASSARSRASSSASTRESSRSAPTTRRTPGCCNSWNAGQQRGDLNAALDAGAVARAFRSLANGTITGWLYQDDGGSLVDAHARGGRRVPLVRRTPSAGASAAEREHSMTRPRIAYDPFATEVQADPYPSYARAAPRRARALRRVARRLRGQPPRRRPARDARPPHVLVRGDGRARRAARSSTPSRPSADDEPTEGADAISIVGTDGDTHTRLRTIVNRGFTPRRMAAQERDMRAHRPLVRRRSSSRAAAAISSRCSPCRSRPP